MSEHRSPRRGAPDPLRHRPNHTGAILRLAREDAGFDHLMLAQADGRWSTQDVADVESDRAPLASDVIRHQAALRKLRESQR